MAQTSDEKISVGLLKSLGFSRQQYPDGWFWVLTPKPEEPGFVALYRVLGYTELDVIELDGDEAIIQCTDDLADWSYVIGPDVGTLAGNEVQAILYYLKKQ